MADKNLTVKIRGDNAALSSSLRQSKAGITKFGGFLKSFGSKFGLLGAGLVGTAAGGLGAGLSIKVFTGAIEEVDKLTKLGKQFGISTAEVQKFKAAATLTGTNLQQLLKGFGQLSKGIIQFARDGTGPGAKVFEDLGLSADTLKQSFARGPIAVLKTFGEALNKVEDPIKRSALLEELLGARNKELAVVLSDVQNLFADIDKTFKELDLALTKEETDAVELFRDTWAEIGDILDNKVLKAMANLAGQLQPLADVMLHLLENVIKGGIEGIGESIKELGRIVSTFGGPELQAILAGNPIGRAVQAGGAGLQVAGGVLAGDFSFDKVRRGVANAVAGAFLDLDIPPQFALKIVNAIRGSNIEEVIAGSGLGAPRAGTGTINGRRLADLLDVRGLTVPNADMPSAASGIRLANLVAQAARGLPGGLPEAGTGTINGKSLESILKENRDQTGVLGKINTTLEKSFFKNERTGKVIGVAAP